MVTRQTPVKPVRLAWLCNTAGCSGQLVFTGHSYTMGETFSEHHCTTCGARQWTSTGRYPRVEYVDDTPEATWASDSMVR